MPDERSYERWNHYHAVRVRELRDALRDLNDEDLIVPNDVKNLSVYDGDDTAHYKGYIDFSYYAKFYGVESLEGEK